MNYPVYNPTYSACIDVAIQATLRQGYTIKSDDLWQVVACNSSRPKEGKTMTCHLPLFEDDKPQRKWLHISVYGMNPTYELNFYIL